MSKLNIVLGLLLFSCMAHAQEVPRNTINTNASATKTQTPEAYRIKFLVQEEEKYEGYNVIGKYAIDSVKVTFFKKLAAYGIREKDLTIVKKSSAPSQRGNSLLLSNIVYEIRDQKPDMAQKLVDNLRFPGMKGIVAFAQYPNISKTVQDSLYTAALTTAGNTAASLAKMNNKSVGEVYNIRVNNSFTNGYYVNETDIYALSKFDISPVDTRTYTCMVDITYELRK